MQSVSKLVVVDDDTDCLRMATALLRDLDVTVRAVHSGEAALRVIDEEGADLLLTDLIMPEMDGQALLLALRAQHPQLPVLIMSAQESVDRAVSLVQMGAAGYISKPLQAEDFRRRVSLALESVQKSNAEQLARDGLVTELELGPNMVLGSAPEMLAVWRRLRRVARTTAPVLLLGESGTGKEILAGAVHSWSPRRGRPFVTVNCGSIPEGLWESELFGHRKGAFTSAQADHAGLIASALGGTLFLDEIGEIPLPSQAKLLRFLEGQEFRRLGDTKTQQGDVRIVSATNRDLSAMIRAGRFREDLFYRLAVISVAVPPLRARMSDLPEFATHLLREAATQFGAQVEGFSPPALARLLAYPWPGNIRELRNKIQQAVAGSQGPLLGVDELDLPVELAQTLQEPRIEAIELLDVLDKPLRELRKEILDRFERDYLRRLLAATQGNVSRAALKAGLPRKALARLITRHDMASHAHGRRGRPRLDLDSDDDDLENDTEE